jgi:CheY-like chemotaxis protein
MREIIAWLRQVEELAGEAYREAAGFFSDDEEFSAFLLGLAEDEALHYHVVGSAAALFEEHGGFPSSAVELDDETRNRVEEPLRRCVDRVQEGTATQTEVLSNLIDAEHSEWNHIFVYVMRQCQGRSRAFQRTAAIIDAHGKKIDAWKDCLPAAEKLAIAPQSLPRVWRPRFLVVEDDDSLRELFGKVLSGLGEVVTAANGQEGLRHARNQFFDVTISDQDMPILTGMEMFRLSKEFDAGAGQHFILCTGNATNDVRLFCRDEGLRLLEKPVSLTELRDAVLAMLETTDTRSSSAG